MRRYLGLLVPLLFLGAAFAAACGGDSKTVKIPGGGEVSTSNKLPNDFPSDFPVYPGAKVVGSIKGDQKGLQGFFVTWETGDQVDKVTAFYKKEFEKGPWKSESTLESGDTVILGAKKVGKTAALTIGRADNKTTIAVFLGDDNSSSGAAPTKTGSGSSSDNKTATAQAGQDAADSGSSSSSEKSPTASPLPPEVKLPKDFPTDRVPLPGDARVTSSTSFGQGGAKSYIITYYTKSSPEAAADYFSKEMPKHGWSDSFSSNTNGEFFVTFTSGATSGSTNDGLTVTASQSDTPGYTQVGLSVSLTAAQ